MSKFSVGEIAILALSGGKGSKAGEECEVIKIGYICLSGTKKDYGIKTAINSSGEGGLWGVDEATLHKRKPPREDLGDWESLESNIGWERPVEVVT